MSIILDGTAGIQNNATDLSYTGTLTGGTGVVNLGSGQVYKDASGNVGIGTSSPASKLQVNGQVRGVNGSAAAPAFTSSSETNAGLFYGDDGVGSFLGFAAGGIEGGRFDRTGRLLVNQTSSTGNDAKLQVSAQAQNAAQFIATGGGYSLVLSNLTNSGLIYFNYGTTNVGTITTSGTSTAYNTTSDYRLKEAVAPMTGALAKVAALKPVTYKWKSTSKPSEGFIAHELQAIVPECVTGEKDAVDAEGKPQYQGIDTSFLVATLTAAIQEQQALIQSLTTRITALEAK